MKKILVLVLAAVLLLSVAACGDNKNAPGTIKDGKSLQDVLDAVDAKFNEKYPGDYGAVPMRMPIDEQYISDFMALDGTSYDEYAGSVAGVMLRSDALFAIKAKEGRVEAVRQAVEKQLSAITAQFEFYPVSGSYDRAKAGEAYVKGNYVFLIIVGASDPDVEGAGTYDADVQMTKETIDGMFNA